MSGDGFTVKVSGLRELKETLAGIVPKLRKRALRNALAAGARLVRDEAKRLRRSSRRRITTKNRTVVSHKKSRLRGTRTDYRHGAVARAISVRTSKVARRAGDVGVFVNVRPLSKGKASRKNPDDPFYWRWLEFGTKFMNARAFLSPAAVAKLQDALTKFTAVIGPEIQKLDRNPKDQL